MKRLILLIILTSVFLITAACGGEGTPEDTEPVPPIKVIQFGTPGFDSAGGVAVNGAGSLYVVGSTAGTFAGQTGSGSTDAFVLRTLDAPLPAMTPTGTAADLIPVGTPTTTLTPVQRLASRLPVMTIAVALAEDWQLTEFYSWFGGFSLRLPPGRQLRELQGIDSYVGETEVDQPLLWRILSARPPERVPRTTFDV